MAPGPEARTPFGAVDFHPGQTADAGLRELLAEHGKA
jgi:hypothetical protein